MPKVSVVIPTYNRANFIAESIQSVLDQTFTDFEIVIIDDGSTDNTREVIDSFRDRRIRYTHQENGGVGSASNRGFELSAGEYIAFFSSDDILVEDALERGVEALDRHPEVAFSYGQIYLMDERGHVFGLRKPRHGHATVRPGTEEIRKAIIDGNHIPAMTIMARRNCLFEVGLYDPAFSDGSEDLDLWVRLARKYPVAYIPAPLAKYRMHSGCMTIARAVDEELETKSRILESVFNDPELGPRFASLRSRAYFYLHLRLARHAYEAGDMKSSREQLSAALKFNHGKLFEVLHLTWIYQFAKTWIPLAILPSIRNARRHLSRVVQYRARQVRTESEMNSRTSI